MTAFSKLINSRVPRYTSYPTAPHFHAGIDAATLDQWLGALPAKTPLSLYVHIPFCDTLCWFCGCHTTVVNRYSPVDSYLNTLFTEIANIAPKLKNHSVVHLHWGGGSPTMLKPDDVRALKKCLEENFTFEPDAEFAVEIDPRGLKEETVKALAEAGLTRASIGVQDFDPKVQAAINRIQPFDETERVATMLRDAGVKGLNIDLIYGLPHQSRANVARTIELALRLHPQRFAVFGYAHVPHFKKHMELIKEEALPDAAERYAQFEAAHAQIEAAGYVPIGLDHFALAEDSLAKAARAGTLARNFQGYTADDAPVLIGLGASSISALPQGYVQNIAGVPDWRKKVEAGEMPVARGIALSDDDRMRRAIIEQLMCFLAVDLKDFGKGAANFTREMEALEALAAEGLVRIEGSRLTVPPEARAGVRLVASVFDAYLGGTKAVHAIAV